MYTKAMFSTGIPTSRKQFQSIISFYLFNCPVEGKSIRATTFEQKGWKGALFSKLKTAMLDNATPELKNRYFPCKKDELEKKFDEIEKLKATDEYCVFLKHDELRVMESLYSAIRNSLAHGSFVIRGRTKMYYFANYDGYLKAIINLREETLLNWIAAFDNPPGGKSE